MKLRSLVLLMGTVLAIVLLTGFILDRSLSSAHKAESKTSAFVPSAPEVDTASYLPIAPYDTDDASPTASPTTSPTPSSTRPPGAIIVDHTSVDDFEHIPDQYIEAAANIRMLFMDASVGGNISQGLDCLAIPSSEQAPIGCTRYEHIVPEYSSDPSEVSWSHPGGYPRGNWTYQFWPQHCGGWYDKVGCFREVLANTHNQYDVYSPQFSYLDVRDSESIADQPGGFFWDNPQDSDIYDLEQIIAQYPNTTVIFATTSLARGIGTLVSENFNNQMREYAINNGKVLFDIAAIVSHDPSGNPCYDNRDGVFYDNGNDSEDFPDDGLDLDAVCQHYTAETNGGHLRNPSVGQIRVAKAFWVLMAKIAGWNGSSQ